MTLRRLLFLLLALLAVVPAEAGGKKKSMPDIAFHMETSSQDNPKMIFPQTAAGRERYFRRLPEVIRRDLAAFTPFPARNGVGYGILIQLKPGANTRLTAVTADNVGRYLLARVNGRFVDAVLIDQAISDGKLVIWSGVELEEIHGLDKNIPRIGEKKPRG